jgi:hypothetical protein
VSTWKVILATLVIYCAGILTGGLVMKASRRASPAPPPPPIFPGSDFFQQRFLDRLKRELSLRPEQIQRLEGVFRDSRERMNTWWQIISPEMKTEIQQVQDKIRAELDVGQREKFEAVLKARRHSAARPARGEGHSREHRPGPQRNQPGRSNEPAPPSSPSPAPPSGSAPRP